MSEFTIDTIKCLWGSVELKIEIYETPWETTTEVRIIARTNDGFIYDLGEYDPWILEEEPRDLFCEKFNPQVKR